MELPGEVQILPGTDVDHAWRRFRPFEALHHRLAICNPLRPEDLDLLLDVLDPDDGQEWLDLACGHGELLIRAAERAAILGTGVDLSPWVLARAVHGARSRRLRGKLTWVLGDAAAYPERPHDVATCLGATWVFGDFSGTVSGLVRRVRPGGLIAIGDLQVRSVADRKALEGRPEAAAATRDEQIVALRALGVKPVAELVPPDEAWAAYHRGVIDSAKAYDDPAVAVDYVAMARQWQRDYEDVRRHLAWTIWVGSKE